MKILANILKESEQYYRDIKIKLERQIISLPKGNVKERKISGNKYYYHQFRDGKKVIHKYLGKEKPSELLEGIAKRQFLHKELQKVKEALKILKRSKGRKRDKVR